jgi:hypothetical protein
MPKKLCPTAFTGDHWTEKYRQVDFTSIAVSFVDHEFVLTVYDLCVKEYGEDSKHAQSIQADLNSKLREFDVSDAELEQDGKFVCE